MSYEVAYTEFEDALYGIITDTTALPITFRNASNQRLTEQYIQLHIGQVEEVGWDIKGDYDVNGNQITYKEYEASVDIACHAGKNTTLVLQKILHQLSTGSGLYYKYFPQGTRAYLRASRITRRDWPLDRIQWEERSVMTVVFNMMVAMSDVEDVGSIETVEIIDLDVYNTPTNIAVEDSITVTFP